MAQTIVAPLDAGSFRFGILAARFNEFITARLVDGALDCLKRHGGKDDAITVAWVPGSFEIPLAAKKAAESGRFDALLALGCLIRGQTPHFDYVASETAKGISNVSLATGVPIAFGIITAQTLEQAVDRAGAKMGNKGADAALAAIEMAGLLRLLSK